MKASIKLLSSKNTKNGHPVCVELFISSKKRTRKTIGYSEAVFWDEQKNVPLNQHPLFGLLMPVVMEYQAKCYKVNLGNYSPVQAAQLLFGEEKQETEAMLLEFFDVRIAEKQTKNQPFTSYENVKGVIEAYLYPETDMPINALTYEWLNDFMNHKLKHNCNMGGVMSYFRTLRAVYKEAQRRTSLNVKADNPFLGIMTNPTPKPVIDVSLRDFKKILQFQPNKNTTPRNEAHQYKMLGLWLFQLCLGGHDLVDVALLKWENIANGRANFKRHKNRNKKNGGPEVSNKLVDEALAFIQLYGDKNSDRVFSFVPCPVSQAKKYGYFRRNYNKSLERISNELKFKRSLTSKSTRYIFRTFAGELLVHDLIVMKLQGHTPEGISYNYQGILPKDVIDSHHRTILDYLQTEAKK